MISHGVPKTLLALAPPPAALRAHPLEFLRRNPDFRNDLVARSSVFAAGVLFWQWPLLLIGALLWIGPVLRWRRIVRTMYYGSAAAAKVVGLSPAMIAFLGDLSRDGENSIPVLVIAHANLTHEGHALDRGDRVALVATAVGGTEERAERFDGHVVSSVVAQPEAVDRTLADVPEWQWDDLEEALFAAPNLYAPGVYPI